MPVMAERTRERKSRFFILLSAGAAGIVFVGFAPTYYLGHWFRAPVLSPLVHLHGLASTAWILLFAFQAGLVRHRKIGLHRRVGVYGAGLAAALVILGVLTAIVAARHGHTPDPAIPPLSFLAIPLFNILAFGILVAAAVYRRHDASWHKRLIATATIAILAPALARFPLTFIQTGGPPAFFGLTDLVLLSGIAREAWVEGRIHPGWWWGGGLLLASQAGSLAVAGQGFWLGFAGWLTG